MVGDSAISNTVENVLILQGGGSLGAFGCGVFKALASNNIKIDVVAGTSIGGLNAAIIAGGKQEDHPEEVLEQYWLELAEGSTSSASIDKLPANLQEVQHRARDIMFSDKTVHNVQLSKAITYYLRLIDDLYKMLERHFDLEDNNKEDKEKFENIRARYKKVSEKHGAEIKAVHYITRSEPYPSLYENADFSLGAIKNSIKHGETKTNDILKEISN